MIEADEITLTLPREQQFHSVAHLVLGGLALRLNLTIETLEDLQLALDAILDRASHDTARTTEPITIMISLGDGSLETSVGPVDLAGELAADEADLNLRRILWTVVDDVELDGHWIRLTKKLDG